MVMCHVTRGVIRTDDTQIVHMVEHHLFPIGTLKI